MRLTLLIDHLVGMAHELLEYYLYLFNKVYRKVLARIVRTRLAPR